MGLVLRRRKVMGDAPLGYVIQRSLRHNPGDSPRGERTMGTVGTNGNKRFTLAWDMKIGGIGTERAIFNWQQGASRWDYVRLGTNNKLELRLDPGGSAQTPWSSNYEFKDPTAWYSCVLTVETDQATQADRVKLWIGNYRDTATNSFSLGATLQIVSGGVFTIGSVRSYIPSWGTHFNGQLANVYYIDGQALDWTSFYELDTATNTVRPKAYAGTFGNNSGWWPFANPASTTTIGYDDAGGLQGSGAGSNDLTMTNYSVTAGVGNDSLVDSPTNGGTDAGIGAEARGNYATVNPIGGNTFNTVTNGNLDIAATGANWGWRPSTLWVNSGKYRAQFTLNATGGNQAVSIGNKNTVLTNLPGGNNDGWSWYNASMYLNGTPSAFGANYTNGDVLDVLLDADAKTVSGYKNGVLQNTVALGFDGPYFICPSVYGSSNWSCNYGQHPWAYSNATLGVSGFLALCTQNLPDPAIPNPKAGHDIKLRAGTGAAAVTTGVAFPPDSFETKQRSTGSVNWGLFDFVRGATKVVESSVASAEGTQSGVTVFNNDGVSLGTNVNYNGSGATYVDFYRRRGVTYGYDIVTYTGNGSNRTIPHGVGKVPRRITIYDLTTAGSHRVYDAGADASAPQNGVVYTDLTNAYAAAATAWNNTAPTASVFSLGTDGRVNTNGSQYLAIIEADIDQFSKIGFYIGNGSADGPYADCGFRPDLLEVKRVDSTGNWVQRDTARVPLNGAEGALYHNLPNAEDITSGRLPIDFTAFGFKPRVTHADVNASGGRYIFKALAGQAGKYARAA